MAREPNEWYLDAEDEPEEEEEAPRKHLSERLLESRTILLCEPIKNNSLKLVKCPPFRVSIHCSVLFPLSARRFNKPTIWPGPA